MVRFSKKQQKRGVDFKKIKRKIGRKLPPPNNATNTEIKSKAIILPEQSVASEKAGLAVSKKGLTLKELLQQTSHHNPKVRKDALMGIRDLFLRYPEELRSHKYAVMEKLRERVSDDDRVVRETLYLLLKSVIFPSIKEENKRPLVSLMMAYIFNAMTNLAIDVRLMAFKFFDLIVEYYPPAFSLYAEKILQNYEDILRRNQFFIQDKGKLKVALAGLVRCLSLLPCDKKEVISCEQNAGEGILHAFEPDVPTELAGFFAIINKLKDLVQVLVNCFQDFLPLVHTLDTQSFDCMLCILQSLDHAVRFFVYGMYTGRPESESRGPDFTMSGQSISSVLLSKLLVVFPLNPVNHFSEKDDDRYFTLNIVITEIFLHLTKWICTPPVLMERFLKFIETALIGKITIGKRSGRAVREKHLLSLLPFVPNLLVSEEANNWKSRLLQAFTEMFKDCNPESSLKLACLSTVEEMLIPRQDLPYIGADNSVFVDHQLTWIRELPLLLVQLGDKHPACSQIVLRLQLRLGQCGVSNSLLAQEFDNMQYSLCEFYSSRLDENNINYGPFIRLARDSQELAVCCLYYFSFMDPLFLKSIASCCLCHNLEPFVLFRILEILHSAYKAGHIQIADHMSFFITLLSQFKVCPENIYPVTESNVKISNRGTFKSVTSVICSFLLQMGDSSLVFELLEKVIVGQLSLRLPLDNYCAMLRMLITLDSKPTRLSEQSIMSISNFITRYLIDVVHCIPEDDDEATVSICIRERRYYLLPCFYLFDRSNTLLFLVLNIMGSLITQSSSLPFSTNCTSGIIAIVSVLLLMQKDVKLQPIMSSSKAEIDCILLNISHVQSSEEIDLTIKEKHKIQCAYDRLKILTSTSPSRTAVI